MDVIYSLLVEEGFYNICIWTMVKFEKVIYDYNTIIIAHCNQKIYLYIDDDIFHTLATIKGVQILTTF